MANDILLINTDAGPVNRKHIAYTVERKPHSFRLIAIEECYYPHPEAPTLAFVQRIETRTVAEYGDGQPEAAPLYLLWNAERNVAINRKDVS